MRSAFVQTQDFHETPPNLQTPQRESPASQAHSFQNPQFLTTDCQTPALQTPNLESRDPDARLRRDPIAQRGALFQPGPQAAGILQNCADEKADLASNKRPQPTETVDYESPPEKKQRTQSRGEPNAPTRKYDVAGDAAFCGEESFPPQELFQMNDTISARKPSLQSDPSQSDPLECIRPGELSLQSETLSKLSLWGCSDVRTLELECPALSELNLTSCTGLTPGNILLRCWGLARVHAAGCKGGVAEAIQEQVNGPPNLIPEHFLR